jgi:hypothetical protein
MKKVNPKPAGDESEPRMPTDLRKALAATPTAKAQWRGLTPIARRDFDRLSQTIGDTWTQDRESLLDACGRKATPLLFFNSVI